MFAHALDPSQSQHHLHQGKCIAAFLLAGDEKWKACGYAAATISLALITTGLLVKISYAQRDFSTAVSNQHMLCVCHLKCRATHDILCPAFWCLIPYVSREEASHWLYLHIPVFILALVLMLPSLCTPCSCLARTQVKRARITLLCIVG